MRNITTKTVNQTQKLAANLAKKIIKAGPLDNGALVVGLVGDLGAGKTVFTQGFAAALGVKEKVVSPTFVLLRRYKIEISGFKNLIHIDAYRIENSEEILELGWKQIVEDPENIIVVEWAERVKNILPKKSIEIKIEHFEKDKRRIGF